MVDFDILRLTPQTATLPFDCGNQDINEFLLDDARLMYFDLKPFRDAVIQQL